MSMIDDVREFMRVGEQAMPDRVEIPLAAISATYQLAGLSETLADSCIELKEMGATASNPADKLILLRARLMVEELGETLAGMVEGDAVQVADGLADLLYVTIGTALAFGIPLEGVWSAVQQANMAKFPGGKIVRDEQGKVVKPEGWTPPDIAGVLAQGGGVLDSKVGDDRPPSRYTAQGRETVDRMRDLCRERAAEMAPPGNDPAEVNVAGDMIFTIVCETHALKYKDRAGLKEGEDAEVTARKAAWWTAMADHVRGNGPDPRSDRTEGATHYVEEVKDV